MKSSKKINIIDYGLSNLFSVSNAINFLGFEPNVTSSPAEILNADALILPGVGSFAKGIQNLIKFDLFKPIQDAVIDKNIPILGICLGMQLLAKSSTEGEFTEGLGLVDASVDHIGSSIKVDIKDLVLPHIGFSSVSINSKSILFDNLSEDNRDFYFVHSYRIKKMPANYTCSYCRYYEKFVSSFELDNIFATQFHPEKSQSNGLSLLKSFLSL